VAFVIVYSTPTPAPKSKRDILLDTMAEVQLTPMFSAEQFEEFMESCTARLQAAAAEGFSKVRAYVGLLRCARSLSHFTLQINVTFRLKKLADAADASAAKNVDTGRKRLHYGTVRAPAACRVCRRSLIAFRRRTVGWTGRLGRQSA
jgi:hypothetical protein